MYISAGLAFTACLLTVFFVDCSVDQEAYNNRKALVQKWKQRKHQSVEEPILKTEESVSVEIQP